MGDALWSGWGVRTMSSDDRAVQPLRTTTATRWPHDNSLIAWGLARYGRWPEAQRIVRQMLTAGAALRPPTAGGLRRPATAETRLDRLPHSGAAAGLGGWHPVPSQLLLGLRPDRR